jgi:hypothetical protein
MEITVKTSGALSISIANKPYETFGGTGMGVRLLAEFLRLRSSLSMKQVSVRGGRNGSR